MTTPKLYTPDEVAELLKLSKRTVLDMIRGGTLGHYSLGHKTLRVSEDHLDAYLNAHKGDQAQCN